MLGTFRRLTSNRHRHLILMLEPVFSVGYDWRRNWAPILNNAHAARPGSRGTACRTLAVRSRDKNQEGTASRAPTTRAGEPLANRQGSGITLKDVFLGTRIWSFAEAQDFANHRRVEKYLSKGLFCGQGICQPHNGFVADCPMAFRQLS